MREVSIATVLDRYLKCKRNAIVDFIMSNQIICPEDVLPEHIKRYEEKVLESRSSAVTQRFKIDAVRDFCSCLGTMPWTLP